MVYNDEGWATWQWDVLPQVHFHMYFRKTDWQIYKGPHSTPGATSRPGVVVQVNTMVEHNASHMTVHVKNAGTGKVVGMYKRSPAEENVYEDGKGGVYDRVFRSQAGHCLIHSPDKVGPFPNMGRSTPWPSGWYITEDGAHSNGMYFNGSGSLAMIPEEGWEIYRGPYSTPGAHPPPELVVKVGDKENFAPAAAKVAPRF